MPASRVRVRPPQHPPGLMVFAAVLGAVFAIPVAAHSAMMFDLIRWTGANLAIVNGIAIAIMIGAAAVLVSWLPRLTHRPLWVAAAGATFGAAMLLFSQLFHSLAHPATAFDDPLESFAALAIATTLGCALALISLVVHRILLFQLLEQDGTLCNTCGYPAGRSGSNTCPECGTPMAELVPTRCERLVSAIRRRRRAVVLVFVVTLIAGNAAVWWRYRDHASLRRLAHDAWEVEWMGLAQRPNAASPHESWQLATVASRPIEQHSGPLVVMELINAPVWRSPQMRIRLGLPAAGGSAPHARPGNAIVYTEVPGNRVRDVIVGGPPDVLVRRLLKAAEQADWSDAASWWTVTQAIEVPWDADD